MTVSAEKISSNPVRQTLLWVLLPFAVLIAITVVFTLLDMDRSISNHFYRPAEGWYLGKQPLWNWLHKKGTIPGILLAVGCLLVWLLSYYRPGLRHWRKPCLVVVLTAVLGAGILVNAVLKQYWGRPRPSQTIEYGGQWEYRPIFPPGTPGQGASFPTGHSTMGFLFLACAAFYPRSKSLALAGVGTGVVLGGLLSAARVVQGAHFTSDTLWSFGLVGMTAAGLMIWLPEAKESSADEEDRGALKRKRRRLTIVALVAVLLMAGGFLTRRPFFNTRQYPFPVPAGIAVVNLLMTQPPERLTVVYAEKQQALLQVDAHGFGWLKFDYRQNLRPEQIGERLDLRLSVEAKSYFAELDHGLTLTLPVARQRDLQLLLNGQPFASGKTDD